MWFCSQHIQFESTIKIEQQKLLTLSFNLKCVLSVLTFEWAVSEILMAAQTLISTREYLGDVCFNPLSHNQSRISITQQNMLHQNSLPLSTCCHFVFLLVEAVNPSHKHISNKSVRCGMTGLDWKSDICHHHTCFLGTEIVWIIAAPLSCFETTFK